MKRHVTAISPYKNAEGDCSCVIYARSRLPNLPKVHTPADLEPNYFPEIGAAVLLDYKLDHIAIIEEIHPDGVLVSEVNFSRTETCQITGRFVSWRDPALRGFYKAPSL